MYSRPRQMKQQVEQSPFPSQSSFNDVKLEMHNFAPSCKL